MNSNTILLALRLFYRELKARNFNIILLALTLAITLLTTVNLYADRLNRAIYNQASELIGGDLIVQSALSFNDNLDNKAKEFHLQTAKFIFFPTMLRIDERLQLVSLKAVSDNYPLRGKINLKNNADTNIIQTTYAPQKNEIWLDTRIMQILNLKLGDKVTIGNSQFKFTKILISEPDVGNNFINLAPRALVNLNDIIKSDILQPGSRINYTQLIAGNDKQIANFTAWLKANLTIDQKLISARDNSNQLTPLIDNSLSFLNLVIFICVILSGIAIAASSYRFYQRQQMTAALFKCFGLSQAQVLIIYFLQLLFLAIISSLISILLAIILQFSIDVIAKNLLTFELPAFSYKPIFETFLSATVLLFLFSLPNFIHFKYIKTKQLLRNENNINFKSSFVIYYLTALFTSLFLLWLTKNFKLTLIFSSSVLITVISLMLLIQIIFYFIFKLPRPFSNPYKLGLNNTARYSISSILQITSFGLVVMLSMMIFFIKDDLLNQWLKQIPKNAPNYFIINIQKSDLDAIKLFFNENKINNAFFYPISRGRLIKLNNVPIQIAEKNKQHNALRRELNLTWTLALPNDNQIVKGKWFDESNISKNKISLEQSLAEILGFKLGDILTFQIGDKLISATVTSIRYVDWNSFQPNFYVIFPPKVIEDFPYTWLTAIHLNDAQKISLKKLIDQFPNLTIFDVDFLLSEAKRLFKNLSMIIEILWIFSLIASALIFYAVLINSLDERRQQVKILHLLGASQKFIKKMLLTEIFSFGLTAGILGCVFAEFSAAVFAKKYFNLILTLNIPSLFIAIICASSLISIFGYMLLKPMVMPINSNSMR